MNDANLRKILFPNEAKTIVNGKHGWLNRNGDFYPEEVVEKMFKQSEEKCYKKVSTPYGTVRYDIKEVVLLQDDAWNNKSNNPAYIRHFFNLMSCWGGCDKQYEYENEKWISFEVVNSFENCVDQILQHKGWKLIIN